jgi:hypothetical protein
MSLKDSPPAIGVGVGTIDAVLPVPSCRSEFAPQQNALPDEVMPQLAQSADVRPVNVGTPVTWTGVSETVVDDVPSPSCPCSLAPQQYTVPVVVSPQNARPAPPTRWK